MAEEKVHKTTAKKTIRRTTSKVAPRKTPVRKSASSAAVSHTAPRKAPSRTVASAPAPRVKSNKKLLIALAFFGAVLCASVGVGISDRGAIDVSTIIATRKQNATPEEKQTFETIPVQQTQTNVVNGGLVGSNDQTAQTPPVEEVVPEAPTEQATTTDPLLPEEAPVQETQSVPATETISEDTPSEEAQ